MSAGVRHVRQELPESCMVACLAMVMGRTHADVLALIHPDRFDGTHGGSKGNGIGELDALNVLAEHGYAYATKYPNYAPPAPKFTKNLRSPWPPEPWADVHICMVLNLSQTGPHAVLLLRDGTVLDPACDEPKQLSDYPEVYNVTAVCRLPIAEAA